MQLYRAAPLLIFSFNRFKSPNGLFSEKINDKIEFPLYGLDMKPFVLEN